MWPNSGSGNIVKVALLLVGFAAIFIGLSPVVSHNPNWKFSYLPAGLVFPLTTLIIGIGFILLAILKKRQ